MGSNSIVNSLSNLVGIKSSDKIGAGAPKLTQAERQEIANRQANVQEDKRLRRLRLVQNPGATSTSEQFTGRKTLLGQ